MENLKASMDGTTLVLALSGRIDSANAPQCQVEALQANDSNAHDALVLDMQELVYISSVGLRMILRLRKANPEMRIVNASLDVYDILEMTGFTDMIPVQKAYRRISVEGCPVIGEGANGKVYRIDPETIVKVYRNPDCLEDIKREGALARKAFVLGIPTAIPYDVALADGKFCSVFECLEASSISKLISKDSANLDACLKMFVDLLRKIHSTVVKPEDMPDMRENVLGWVEFLKDYLPAPEAMKLLKLVEAVPVQYTMLHGDYHGHNVKVRDGEVLLIDMDTLCYGHPVFELGSVYNAYMGFSDLDHSVVETFQGMPYDTAVLFWKKFLPMYLQTENAELIAATEKKAMLIGYVRLMRRGIRRHFLDTPEGQKAIEYYKDRILSLLEEIDTLVF